MTIHKVLFITLLFFVSMSSFAKEDRNGALNLSCEMDLVSGRPDTAKHFYFIPERCHTERKTVESGWMDTGGQQISFVCEREKSAMGACSV